MSEKFLAKKKRNYGLAMQGSAFSFSVLHLLYRGTWQCLTASFRKFGPSPGPPRLVKAPAAVNPLTARERVPEVRGRVMGLKANDRKRSVRERNCERQQ
jgi:hypothetical protein